MGEGFKGYAATVLAAFARKTFVGRRRGRAGPFPRDAKDDITRNYAR